LFLLQLFFLVFKLNISDLYSLFFVDKLYTLSRFEFNDGFAAISYSYVNGIYPSQDLSFGIDDKLLITSIYKYDSVFYSFCNIGEVENYFALTDVTNTELLG